MRDGVRLFVRTLGAGTRGARPPGIGAEADFAPLCATLPGWPSSTFAIAAAPTPCPLKARSGCRSRSTTSTRFVPVWDLPVQVSWGGRTWVSSPPCTRRGIPNRSSDSCWCARRLHSRRYSPTPASKTRPLANASESSRRPGWPGRDPVAFARAWRRIVVPTRMGDPTAFDKLRGDPSIWPNEWPEHMSDALNRVAATHPVDFDYRPEARRITAPTLVVHGARDTIPLAASEEWARAIPTPGCSSRPKSVTSRMPKHRRSLRSCGAFLDGDWPVGAAPITA